MAFVSMVIDKVSKKAKIRIDTIKYHTRPRTRHGTVTKIQENITYKKAKRLNLSHLYRFLSI